MSFTESFIKGLMDLFAKLWFAIIFAAAVGVILLIAKAFGAKF